MMENFNKGDMVEAVDRYGVWAKCRVLESQYDFAVVTFPPWPKVWDRKIVNPQEIHKTSDEVLTPGNLYHSKVRLFSLLNARVI